MLVVSVVFVGIGTMFPVGIKLMASSATSKWLWETGGMREKVLA